MAVSADFRTTSASLPDALDEWSEMAEPRFAPWPFHIRVAIIAVGAVLAWAPVVWALDLA